MAMHIMKVVHETSNAQSKIIRITIVRPVTMLPVYIYTVIKNISTRSDGIDYRRCHVVSRGATLHNRILFMYLYILDLPMDSATALLLVVIIILIFREYKRCGAKPTDAVQLDCTNKATGEAVYLQYGPTPAAHGAGCSCEKCAPEANAVSTNIEHYAAGINDATGDYGQESFSSGGGDYKDFIASLSVDPQTLKNHSEFTRDRLAGQNQIVTGRTYAMGEVEGNSSNWWGIRGRPQLIPELSQGNPTQIPDDVRETDYTIKPRFNWDSTPY